MEISTYYQEPVTSRAIPVLAGYRHGAVHSALELLLHLALLRPVGRAVKEKPCTVSSGGIHKENVGHLDPPPPAAMPESLKRVRAGSEYYLNYPLFSSQG